MFPYIYSLLVEKNICDHQNVLIKLLCVCVCLLSGDLFIFSVRDFSFFSYFLCYQYFHFHVDTLYHLKCVHNISRDLSPVCKCYPCVTHKYVRCFHYFLLRCAVLNFKKREEQTTSLSWCNDRAESTGMRVGLLLTQNICISQSTILCGKG